MQDMGTSKLMTLTNKQNDKSRIIIEFSSILDELNVTSTVYSSSTKRWTFGSSQEWRAFEMNPSTQRLA